MKTSIPIAPDNLGGQTVTADADSFKVLAERDRIVLVEFISDSTTPTPSRLFARRRKKSESCSECHYGFRAMMCQSAAVTRCFSLARLTTTEFASRGPRMPSCGGTTKRVFMSLLAHNALRARWSDSRCDLRMRCCGTSISRRSSAASTNRVWPK